MADNVVEVTLKMIDNFTTPMTKAIKLFESGTQELIQTGQTLSDKYSNFLSTVGSIKGKIKDVNNFTKSIDDTAKKFEELKKIGKIGNNFSKFDNVGKAAFVKLNAGSKEMGTVLKTAIELIKNPTFQVLAVITAISIAAYLIIKNWSKVKPFFIKFATSIKNTFTKISKTIADWYYQNQDLIKKLAIVLLTMLGPSLIITAKNAVIAGANITKGFVKSLVTAGKQAVVSGAKTSVSFTKSLVSTGMQAVRTGTQIMVGLVRSFIKYIAMGWKAVAVGAKNILVFIGQKVAMIGLKVATGAMSRAQLALNSAFLASPITWIVLGIIAVVAAGYLLIKNWKTVKKVATMLWKGIKSVFGGIGNWFSGIWEGVKSGFKGFINFIIGGLNKIPEGLNSLSVKIPSWVPKVGGNKLGFSVPTIPYLAKGTNNWAGGLAITQERGGEIMDLPKGTRVYPHDKSLQMARAEGVKKGNTDIQVNINKLADKLIIRSDDDIDKLADAMANKLVKVAGNIGKVVYA